MKNINLLISTLCLLFFGSACKKQMQEQNYPEKEIYKPISEQAYPNMSGEIITTNWHDNQIKVERKGGRYVWLGDIAFDQQTFDSLNNVSNRMERTFNPDASHQWLKGIVAFTIDPNFTANERTFITDAMNNWTTNTGITFIERTSEWNYVQFVRGVANSGLFSDYIGMKGGMQTINLEGGQFNTGSVIHEIGHTIGFYHEQSRTDRDNSIVIHPENIISGRENNFMTYTALNEPGAQLGVFDFNSVMLYDSWAFSRNGQPTITRLNGTTFTSNRAGLSIGDIETSDFMYGPPFARVRTVSTDYSSQDQDYIVADIFIDFFSDPACTMPFTLPEDKNISISNYQENYQGGEWSGATYSTNVTLPSGANTYTLESSVTLTQISYDYGNITYGFRQTYDVRNGFVRFN
jgi:hypothetical protein